VEVDRTIRLGLAGLEAGTFRDVAGEEHPIRVRQQAGEVRFVPIVLTTLTAIGGLLPLAVEGSSLYSPLAWVIIGGLVSSTILARLVTPVMYKLLAPEIAVRSVPVTAITPKQVREPELAGV
jgi:hypothetical protein